MSVHSSPRMPDSQDNFRQFHPTNPLQFRHQSKHYGIIQRTEHNDDDVHPSWSLTISTKSELMANVFIGWQFVLPCFCDFCCCCCYFFLLVVLLLMSFVFLLLLILNGWRISLCIVVRMVACVSFLQNNNNNFRYQSRNFKRPSVRSLGTFC